MTREEQKRKIREVLEDSLTTNELVDVWNEFCEANNWDEIIFSMGEFDEVAQYRAPHEIVEDAKDNFNINDNYFIETIYGFESNDDPQELMSIDDLIDEILNGDDLNNIELRDALEEIEEEERTALSMM